MEVPRLSPMLASSGAIPGRAEEWCFEPKWDGWRAVVTVTADKVCVRTRTGRDVTSSLPELGPLADVLGGRSAVLDGELVANSGNPESFYRLGPRMNAITVGAARKSASTPVTLVAFDVLWVDGEVVTDLPYIERRELLGSLIGTGPAWCINPSYPVEGAELFAACTRLGLEGLVAKRLVSRYRPGERSPDWIKAKCADWYLNHAPLRHSGRPRFKQ